MARMGFKRTYAAGTFDFAAVQDLFADIKTALIAAGFVVARQTATAIDVLRLGALVGDKTDDLPHWAFLCQDASPVGRIYAKAVYGADHLDATGYSSDSRIIAANPNPAVPTQEVRLWFAGDGREGWWWLVTLKSDTASPAGFSLMDANAGVTSRRYPSDQFQGLCARYGIWDSAGSWYPAYTTATDGGRQSAIWIGTWSPFGEGWSFNGQRHAGSPLPRMAVPQFPNRDNSATACLLGEFNEILILTDGYALEEEVVPGWIAFPCHSGAQALQPFALPAPAEFGS